MGVRGSATWNLVGLLENLEQRLCHCRVPIVPLQCRNDLNLTVNVPLPALNSQLGILSKMFQVRAHHAGAQPTRPPGPFFCPWNWFRLELAGKGDAEGVKALELVRVDGLAAIPRLQLLRISEGKTPGCDCKPEHCRKERATFIGDKGMRNVA